MQIDHDLGVYTNQDLLDELAERGTDCRRLMRIGADFIKYAHKIMEPEQFRSVLLSYCGCTEKEAEQLGIGFTYPDDVHGKGGPLTKDEMTAVLYDDGWNTFGVEAILSGIEEDTIEKNELLAISADYKGIDG